MKIYSIFDKYKRLSKTVNKMPERRHKSPGVLRFDHKAANKKNPATPILLCTKLIDRLVIPPGVYHFLFTKRMISQAIAIACTITILPIIKRAPGQCIISSSSPIIIAKQLRINSKMGLRILENIGDR
jgi:hypothetical protein